jgi:hypothetical protein
MAGLWDGVLTQPTSIGASVPSPIQPSQAGFWGTALQTAATKTAAVTPSKIATLPANLGGGAYNLNPANPQQVINTGHTTYAGMPSKAGFQRNDIVPVSLGGSNSSPANLQYQPADQAAYRDKVETYYAAQVKAGKIATDAARVKVLDWQNTDIPGQEAYSKQIGGSQNLFSNFIKSIPDVIGGAVQGVKGLFAKSSVTPASPFTQNPIVTPPTSPASLAGNEMNAYPFSNAAKSILFKVGYTGNDFSQNPLVNNQGGQFTPSSNKVSVDTTNPQLPPDQQKLVMNHEMLNALFPSSPAASNPSAFNSAWEQLKSSGSPDVQQLLSSVDAHLQALDYPKLGATAMTSSRFSYLAQESPTDIPKELQPFYGSLIDFNKPTFSVNSQLDNQGASQALISSATKDVGNSIVGGVKGVASKLVSQFTNPSPQEVSMEQGLPQPFRTLETPVMRFVSPMVQPFVNDAAAAIVFSNKNLSDKFMQQAQSGAFSQATDTGRAGQTIIAATQKTPAQVIGDTAQAVLAAYTPAVFGSSLSGFAAKGFIQASASAVAQGAAQGFLFGSAQAASSGSKDPVEIAKIIAVNTATMAVFNLATTAVAHGLAASVDAAMTAINDHIQNNPELLAGSQRGFIKNPFASEPAPENTNIPAIVDTIDRHVTSAQQVTANLSPAEIQNLGGQQSLISRVQTNIVDGLKASGQSDAANAIAKLDTAAFSSPEAFGQAAKDAISTPSDIGMGQVPAPETTAPSEVPPTPEAATPAQSAPSGQETPAPTVSTVGQDVSSSQVTPTNGSVNPQVSAANLNITPEAKTLLDNLSQDLSPKTAAKVGDTMTNQEVIDFAKANPNITLSQVSRDASLKANAALLQARQTLAAQIQSLQDGTASVADQATIIKNFLAVKTTLTDTARALQSAGIGADPTEGSTVSDIISKIAKTGANVDDIIAAAKGVDFNNYNQVVDFYRQFVKPTAGNWIDVVRYNSMLSSPLTLSNISSGNLFNVASQPVVKSTAGALDWLKTGVFGGEQTHFVGEGPAYVKGAAASISDAFGKFTDVMSGNLDPKMLDFNIPLAGDQPAPLHIGGQTVGFDVNVPAPVLKGLNIFSTLHNAMYQFFNTIAQGGSSAAISYKGEQGVSTALPDVAAQAEADYATFRAGTLPEGQGNVLNAIDSIANAFKQWSASDNPALAWPTKFTLPFLRISTNMAKQMVEYSPAGFSTAIGAADPITQFAKASLGTASFAAIGTMAATGNITGAAPTVPADKQAFDASGRQAYSIKIGNQWVSYNKLPPSMSIPMLLSASYVQSQASGQGKDVMQSVLESFASFGKYLADQSYVKNIGDLVAAIQGDTTKGNPMETLVTNDAQQLLPFRAFSGWLAKALDPNQRKIDTSKGAIQTQIQSLMLQIPGLRQQLNAKVDAAGNPIPNTNRVVNAVSPFQVSNTSSSQEQTFQDYLKLKGLSTQATQASKDLTGQAQQTWQQMLTLPKDQAKAQLKQLAQTDPALAKKILSIITTSTTPALSATDTKLKGMSTEARAQFIAQQKSNYITAADYKTYLKDLGSKKILTTAVLSRLTQILQGK